MIIGTTMLKLDANPYYSPQFNRGGNAADFLFYIQNITGGGEVEITIEHKNANATSWNVLTSVGPCATTGPWQCSGSAIEEQLRIKYDLSGSAAVGDGIHVLALAPTWRPY